MSYKIGDEVIDVNGNIITIRAINGGSQLPLSGESDDGVWASYAMNDNRLVGLAESVDTPQAQPANADSPVFQVGDKVEVGTLEFPPGTNNKSPWPGRVICTNVHSRGEVMSMICLVKQYGSEYEKMMQFSAEGKCLNAVWFNGQNDWHYKDYNCYKV